MTIEQDHLTAAEFEELSTIVHTRVGIRLPPGKRTMLESRLRRRLRTLGFNRFSQYCEHLFRSGNFDEEFPYLVDVVTTNKTDFFREQDHFDALEQVLVPTLLKMRRSEATPLLKVWSAASSTGAEAYTAAMVLMNLSQRGSLFRFSVLGTDISREVLETAKSAIYQEDMVRPVPAEYRRRYLMVGSRPDAHVVRIVPELRRYVRFERLNLMDQRYPFDKDVDVIFLRNVLIYFDPDVQVEVSRRLSQHLRPGGYLVLGHSEAAVGRSLDLSLVASGIYQRT